MRKIILAFIFMLVSAIGVFAQSTTVTSTVTDSGGVVWANGTYSFTFNGPAGSTWPGGAITSPISGTLDGSGNLSQSVPTSTTITPGPSSWTLKVCPLPGVSSSYCLITTLTTTGGTQPVTLTPKALAISAGTTTPITAYADAEVVAPVPLGFIYYQATSSSAGTYRLCNAVTAGACTTWSALGGSSGGVCPTGAAGNIQYTDGTNCASSSALNYNSGTGAVLFNTTGTQTYLGSSVTFAAAAGNNVVSVDGVNGVQIQATDAVATSILLASTHGSIQFSSQNLNSSGAELDIGGTVVGNGTLGLNGSTSGKCALASDATATTMSTGCLISTTGSSPATLGSVTQRSVTITTDTILNTDRQNRVVYNSASAVAVTLPQAGSSGFAGGYNVRVSNQNAGVVTITPTVSTINGNATLVLQEGQDCFITPSSTGTSYAADCNEPQVTAGNGISLQRGVHSLTITNSAVTSVSFTGGLISVATPTTTPAFTVAGTSGGIPYFSSTSTWASSALLGANQIILGGGAGVAPFTTGGISSDGSHEIFLGGVGAGVGTIAFSGSTSGTETCNVNTTATTLSCNANFSAQAITGTTFTSTVATGTQPLTVTSTTPVGNLTVTNHPKMQSCGTTSTCSHTTLTTSQVVVGSAALVSGTPSTVTITGISPAFTSSSSYFCTVAGQSSATTSLYSVANVSSSSFTITGPASTTTVVNYICAGN